MEKSSSFNGSLLNEIDTTRPSLLVALAPSFSSFAIKYDWRRSMASLARRETMNRSVRFARLLVVSMRRRVRMVGRSHRFAGFAVLKAPDIPSVLVELGYLSNRADESLLRSARHHAKVARAMRRAIDRFISRRARNSRS